MTTITMTSKGQITLPAATRAKLGLAAGSKFTVSDGPNGEIVLKPKTGDIRALRGFIKYDGPPVSIEEMNESIGRAIVESFKRSIV